MPSAYTAHHALEYPSNGDQNKSSHLTYEICNNNIKYFNQFLGQKTFLFDVFQKYI